MTSASTIKIFSYYVYHSHNGVLVYFEGLVIRVDDLDDGASGWFSTAKNNSSPRLYNGLELSRVNDSLAALFVSGKSGLWSSTISIVADTVMWCLTVYLAVTMLCSLGM